MASAVPRARMAARCVRAWFIRGISLRARGRPVHGWSDRTGIPAARTPCRAAHESRLRPGGGVDMALTTRAGAGARGAQGPGLPDPAGPDPTRRPAMKPHALTPAAPAAALPPAATACNGDARPAQAAAALAQADAPAARAEAPARPFEVDMIASFAEPWAMAFLPDGRLLVSGKRGQLHVVDVESGAMREVAGLPEVDYGGQGGMGDVQPHPDFARNGLVYLSYAEAGAGDTRGAAL